MKAVVTVIGKDSVGIIAEVSAECAKHNANIVDITQSVLKDYFAMIMLVEAGRLPAWIPIVVLFREFIVSGYRLIAVGNDGNVIAASIWGKLKTVTQMIALIIALVDMNAFGAFVQGGLDGFGLVINITSTVIMSISVVATIFSGWDYIKNGKELLLKK